MNSESLLKTFRQGGRFEPGERVILGHTGTVQTILALVFDTPISVRVVDQRREDAMDGTVAVCGNTGNRLVRTVDLVAGGTVVCSARSRIPFESNRSDFLEDVQAGRMGLGQIINKHMIPHSRRLTAVGKDRKSFWRSYEVVGPGLELEIFESFPRPPFVQVGWLQPGHRS